MSENFIHIALLVLVGGVNLMFANIRGSQWMHVVPAMMCLFVIGLRVATWALGVKP